MAAEVLAAADSVRAISRSSSADVLDKVCDSGSRDVRDGSQGREGRDGIDGRDGRDGKVGWEGDFNMCPSGQSGAVRRESTNGMSLPSHLRPPLIVTVASRRPSGSATGTSEDHELLELLSSMKSSPKWEPSLIKPFSSERKRVQENDGRAGGGEGEKRIKMESVVTIPRRKKSVDIGTPTDRALKRVRLELARRAKESSERSKEAFNDDDLSMDCSAGCHDDGIVPFDLLPFFKYLADSTQRRVLTSPSRLECSAFHLDLLMRSLAHLLPNFRFLFNSFPLHFFSHVFCIPLYSVLMAQLVDHFQQTSYTPRNFNALLPTPRLSHRLADRRLCWAQLFLIIADKGY